MWKGPAAAIRAMASRAGCRNVRLRLRQLILRPCCRHQGIVTRDGERRQTKRRIIELTHQWSTARGIQVCIRVDVERILPGMAICANASIPSQQFKPASLIQAVGVNAQIGHSNWNHGAAIKFKSITIHLIVPETDLRGRLPETNHSVKRNPCFCVVGISWQGNAKSDRGKTLESPNLGRRSDDELLVSGDEALRFPTGKSIGIHLSDRRWNWNICRAALVDVSLSQIDGSREETNPVKQTKFRRVDLVLNIRTQFELLAALEVFEIVTPWNLVAQSGLQGVELSGCAIIGFRVCDQPIQQLLLHNQASLLFLR